MSTDADLRAIFGAARPLVEQALDLTEQFASLRTTATEKGLDWSQIKALLKAQVQDERDDSGQGKHVARIIEKADFAASYADMLGLAGAKPPKLNENNFFSDPVRAPEGGSGPATWPAPPRRVADESPATIPAAALTDADGHMLDDIPASLRRGAA